MIAFASLVLGLVVGVLPIGFVVQGPVARVEVALDGATVGQLTHAPWSIELDLGKELAPHEVVARAYAADGKLVGEVRQWLNLPRPLAEAQILVENEGGKEPPRVRVLASSLLGAPKAVHVTFDGRSLSPDASGHVFLPSYDRSTTHILAAKVEYSGGLVADAVTVVGGGAAAETSNALTAIPLRRRGRDRFPSVERAQGWLVRNGQPLRVLAVDHAPAEVIVVRDLDGSRAMAHLGKSRDAPLGVTPGNFPTPESTRSEPHLDGGDRVRIAWPVARRTEGSSGPAELFEQSGELTGENAGFRSLLTRTRYLDGTSAVPECRTAEAVAVAAMRALSERTRRAVVLVVSAERDASTLDPETVRRYLDRIHVPLFVWSLDGPPAASAPPSPWGEAEDISSPAKLEKAVRRLREELDRQEVVWVAGNHLPQEIQLTTQAAGFDIAGSAAAAGAPPPLVQAEATAATPPLPDASAEPATPAASVAAAAPVASPVHGGPSKTVPSVQESAEVHVMNLDLFAADSKGRFVPDLAASDLRVYLDGRPQPIDYFGRVEPPSARTVGGTPDASPPRRFLIYLELSRVSTADAARILPSLKDFVGRMEPGDQARIVAWDRRSREVTGWTADKSALLAGLAATGSIDGASRLRAEQRAIQGIEGADAGLDGDLPEGLTTIQRERADAHVEEEWAAVAAMLRDLDAQVSTLSVVEGKRAILFVSGGLETRPGSIASRSADAEGAANAPDLRTIDSRLQRVMRHANASRVTFFAIDVRGVSAAARPENQEGLRRLGDETGGLAVLNSNDLQGGLARVDEASSRYYSIGLTLASGAVRTYRDVRIETTRPGVSIRYRRGLERPSPNDEAADAVRTALLTRVEGGAIHVSVETGTATRRGASWLLPVKISVPAEDLVFLPQPSGSRASVEIFFAAMDDVGRMSEVSRREAAFRPEDCPAARCSFQVPLDAGPGHTRLAIGVRDLTGKRGLATADFSIR